jgi:hypothetical protein
LQGLSFLIHGPPKAGKSSVSDSGPQPRLILDIEGTASWTPSRKAEWNPMRSPPPQDGGRHLTAGYGQPSVTPAWESCLVYVDDMDVIARTYQVLSSGQHPFNSLSFDSITEGQQRLIDKKVGTRQLELKHWGALLREISSMTRQFRDLIKHPTRPLWSVSFVAGTHFDKAASKWRPLVQGQSADFLPYYVDIEGYIGAAPTGERDMIIGPHQLYETGERVGGRLPYAMRIGYPGHSGKLPGYTIQDMLRQVLTAR